MRMSRNRKSQTGGSLNQLADLVNKAGIQLKAQEKSTASADLKVQRPVPISVEKPAGAAEDSLFTSAMDGVDRAAWRHSPCPASRTPRPVADDSITQESRLMEEAVEKGSPMPVLDHPEYIEGWIGIAGKRFLPNLRNGLYSIQGQIDLHGFNRIEAQIAVEDFIVQMSRFQSCCIKIIHGRGINSPADTATLKESLQRFLSTRRMSRYVIAYASAPQCDGGVGAVYVLLSRQ